LVICESLLLLRRGHPDAVREVQRQMRLVNSAYAEPTVHRLAEEVVRAAKLLHGPPGLEDERLLRQRARSTARRLRVVLETLPPRPPALRPAKPVRGRIR